MEEKENLEKEPTLEQLNEEMKQMREMIKEQGERMKKIEEELGISKKIHADQSGVIITEKERQERIEQGPSLH